MSQLNSSASAVVADQTNLNDSQPDVKGAANDYLVSIKVSSIMSTASSEQLVQSISEQLSSVMIDKNTSEPLSTVSDRSNRHSAHLEWLSGRQSRSASRSFSKSNSALIHSHIYRKPNLQKGFSPYHAGGTTQTSDSPIDRDLNIMANEIKVSSPFLKPLGFVPDAPTRSDKEAQSDSLRVVDDASRSFKVEPAREQTKMNDQYKSVFSKSVDALRQLFKIGESVENLAAKDAASTEQPVSAQLPSTRRMLDVPSFIEWIKEPEIYGPTAILDVRVQMHQPLRIKVSYSLSSLQTTALQSFILEQQNQELHLDEFFKDVHEQNVWKTGGYSRVVLVSESFPTSEAEWDPVFKHQFYDKILSSIQSKPIYWLQGGYTGLLEYLEGHINLRGDIFEEEMTVECVSNEHEEEEKVQKKEEKPKPIQAPAKRRPPPALLLQPITAARASAKIGTPSSIVSALQKYQLKTGYIRPPNNSMIIPDWLIVGEDPCIFTAAPVSASSAYLQVPTPRFESSGGRTPISGSKLDIRASMEYLQGLNVSFVVNMAAECQNLSRLLREAGMISLKKYQKFACEDRAGTKSEKLILQATSMILQYHKQNPYDKIYLHCRLGKSRSITVATLVLMKLEGLTDEEASAIVSQRRDAADANLAFRGFLSYMNGVFQNKNPPYSE